MNMDDKMNRLERLIAQGEMEVKGTMVTFAEENLNGGGEKIAFMCAVSLGVATAAIHCGCEAVERGEKHTGELTMSMVEAVLLPEIERLRKLLNG